MEYKAESLGCQHMQYYYCVDRKNAVKLVAEGGDGCYLVRPSSNAVSLTLTLWNSGRAYNIPIRIRQDGKVALGSKKARELTFASTVEMIKYYEKNPIVVLDANVRSGTINVRLTKFPRRQ